MRKHGGASRKLDLTAAITLNRLGAEWTSTDELSSVVSILTAMRRAAAERRASMPRNAWSALKPLTWDGQPEEWVEAAEAILKGELEERY